MRWFIVALVVGLFWLGQALIEVAPAWLLSFVGGGILIGFIVAGFVVIRLAAKRWL